MSSSFGEWRERGGAAAAAAVMLHSRNQLKEKEGEGKSSENTKTQVIKTTTTRRDVCASELDESYPEYKAATTLLHEREREWVIVTACVWSRLDQSHSSSTGGSNTIKENSHGGREEEPLASLLCISFFLSLSLLPTIGMSVGRTFPSISFVSSPGTLMTTGATISMTDQVTAQSPFFAFCSKFDIRPLPSSTSLRFISRRGSKKRPKPKRPSSVSHKKPAAAHPSTHREIVHRLLIPATLPPAHQVHFEMLDAVQSKPSRTDGANPINRMTHSVFFSFSLSFPTVISLGMTRNLPA